MPTVAAGAEAPLKPAGNASGPASPLLITARSGKGAQAPDTDSGGRRRGAGAARNTGPGPPFMIAL